MSKVNVDDSSNYLLTRLEETIATWNRMVKVVATMKAFIQRCQIRRELRGEFILSVDELQTSERTIIVLLQSKYLSTQRP